MLRLGTLALLALGLRPALAPALAAAEITGYVVVVNEASPARETVGRDELARLFLKRTTRWGNGTEAAPVDLSASNLVRSAFSRAVLGKPISAVQAFWQQEIFAGRSAPPAVLSTDQEVLDFVRRNPGAVGYVAPGTSLGTGVRRVEVAP
jgi:ABC-type phosphate transport system substrate-binding protein